jgi:predicted tellurium resistance membrane protein TerC
MDWLTDPQTWASLLTLTTLEIVLGIDNLVFIAILAGRLPEERQSRARQMGLSLALITRLALLASIAWIFGLSRPLFDFFDHPVSWRDTSWSPGVFSSSTRARQRSTSGWSAMSRTKRRAESNSALAA